MSDLLDALEVQTGAAPRFAVVWMHGLGADGSDFLPVVPHLGLDGAPAVRFVFPNAPAIPVTCNGGWVMPAWYDIVSLAPDAREVDAQGVVRSRAAIRRLIERENGRGIPCARIFLAGFFTVAQFNFWGNYLPRVYPLHLRGTGESFAANIGGRLIGTSFAWVTTSLAVTSDPAQAPARLAWTAALVGASVYVIGFVLSFLLPEPPAEAMPD